MSTCFMTAPASLGMLFLQRCRINFNELEEKAIFEFDLRLPSHKTFRVMVQAEPAEF